MLSTAHTKRNAVQYDAVLEIEEALVDALVRATDELFIAVKAVVDPA